MMSDNYFREGPTTSLVYWGLGQMMKGVAMAALFVVLIGLSLWAIYGIGLLLPEDSKTQPSPYGAVTIEATEAVA
jgi:hypothetical protein